MASPTRIYDGGRLAVSFTAGEREWLERQATAHGVSLGDVVRSVIDGARGTSWVEEKAQAVRAYGKQPEAATANK